MDNELPCGSQIASFLIFPEKIDDILVLGAKGRASQKALPGGQLTPVTRCADSDWRRGIMAITAKSVTGAHSAWLQDLRRKCRMPNRGSIPSLAQDLTERY